MGGSGSTFDGMGLAEPLAGPVEPPRESAAVVAQPLTTSASAHAATSEGAFEASGGNVVKQGDRRTTEELEL